MPSQKENKEDKERNKQRKVDEETSEYIKTGSKKKSSFFVNKNKKKLETSTNFFKGHQCFLPRQKLTEYEIKCSSIRKCLLFLIALNRSDTRAKTLYRSYASLCAEKYHQYKYYPFTVHPYSLYRYWLEVFIVLVITIDSTVIGIYFSLRAMPALKYVICFADIVYLVNITSNMFTGYAKGHTSEYVVLEMKCIILRYLRTWFFVDLISCSGLIFLNGSSEYPSVIVVLIALKILRMPTYHRYLSKVLTVNRIGEARYATPISRANIYGWSLLSLFHLIETVSRRFCLSLSTKVEGQTCFAFHFCQLENITLHSNVNKPAAEHFVGYISVGFVILGEKLMFFDGQLKTTTAVKLICLVKSYLDWNIYFQFGVDYFYEDSFYPVNPSSCSWITIAKLWNETASIRYIYALDRAVGMFRSNSNLSLMEYEGCFELFFIIAWIFGKAIFLHCLMKFIIALTASESAQAKYFMMANQVEIYLKQRQLPPRMKKKILKFYSIKFQSHFFVESRMLACMSGQLREDIILHTGRQLVNHVASLKELPRGLLLQIEMKMKPAIFIEGDIIFKINTVGDCLYFIDNGTVAIYSESGKEICHLEDGDYFGEIALVMKHRFRNASAVAVTNCELFRLDKEDFESSIACYPTVYEDMKKVAANRYERTSILDEHHKTDLKINY